MFKCSYKCSLLPFENFFRRLTKFILPTYLPTGSFKSCHVIVNQPDLPRYLGILRGHVFLHIIDQGQRQLYQGVCTYPALESSNFLLKYETQMLTQYIGLALAMTITHPQSMIMQLMPLRPHLPQSLPLSTSTNIRRLA
jgi:hypothetical protein